MKAWVSKRDRYEKKYKERKKLITTEVDAGKVGTV